ncbi:Nuclear Protein Localization Protein 4-like [Manis pentadactyla]|nr:Nuclear Protein Localization Protein 4-like [Manis pentadactyla]
MQPGGPRNCVRQLEWVDTWTEFQGDRGSRTGDVSGVPGIEGSCCSASGPEGGLLGAETGRFMRPIPVSFSPVSTSTHFPASSFPKDPPTLRLCQDPLSQDTFERLQTWRRRRIQKVTVSSPCGVQVQSQATILPHCLWLGLRASPSRIL